MRYPDGGGLSARGRVQRERVRLEAARLFEQGVAPGLVAGRPRVSTKSAYQWRRRWRAGGGAALWAEGAGGGVCAAPGRAAGRALAQLGTGGAAHRVGW